MTKIMACMTLLAMAVTAAEVYAARAGEESAGTALSTQLQSAWSDIQGKLDRILERRDKNETLPKASLLPTLFTETQESNQRKIDGLLEGLARAMLSSPAYDQLKHIRELEDKINNLRDKERRLRNDAFSAPATRPVYRIDISTADELREKAAICAEDIVDAQKEIAAARQSIADELRSWGVELTPAQQELLFSSVIGDDMLENSIILKNVKAVLEQMAAHVATDARDPMAPKRYYGSYLSFIDILMDSNRKTLSNIRTTWLPRLDAIMEKASDTMADAKKAVRSRKYTEQQIKTLEANVAANQLTIKVGRLYRDFLNRQAEAVEKRLRELVADRATSQNTYDTVTVSSDLSALIQRGLQDLDALGNVTLPDLHIFENFEQQREFAELSSRMLTQGE